MGKTRNAPYNTAAQIGNTNFMFMGVGDISKTVASSCCIVKSKVLPEPQGPSHKGGADLRFLSPQPDTSLHCETTDTGPVYRTV